MSIIFIKTSDFLLLYLIACLESSKVGGASTRAMTVGARLCVSYRNSGNYDLLDQSMSPEPK